MTVALPPASFPESALLLLAPIPAQVSGPATLSAPVVSGDFLALLGLLLEAQTAPAAPPAETLPARAFPCESDLDDRAEPNEAPPPRNPSQAAAPPEWAVPMTVAPWAKVPDPAPPVAGEPAGDAGAASDPLEMAPAVSVPGGLERSDPASATPPPALAVTAGGERREQYAPGRTEEPAPLEFAVPPLERTQPVPAPDKQPPPEQRETGVVARTANPAPVAPQPRSWRPSADRPNEPAAPRAAPPATAPPSPQAPAAAPDIPAGSSSGEPESAAEPSFAPARPPLSAPPRPEVSFTVRLSVSEPGPVSEPRRTQPFERGGGPPAGAAPTPAGEAGKAQAAQPAIPAAPALSHASAEPAEPRLPGPDRPVVELPPERPEQSRAVPRAEASSVGRDPAPRGDVAGQAAAERPQIPRAATSDAPATPTRPAPAKERHEPEPAERSVPAGRGEARPPAQVVLVPETPAERPGATVGSRPAQPAEPASRAPLERASENLRPATPAREIAFQVRDRQTGGVDVRLAERAGQVRVAVRTADAELNASLRRELDSLVTRLEEAGFRAETWAPAADAAPRARAPEQAWQAGPGSSRGHGGAGDEGQGRQGQPRQREQDRPEWREELEQSTGAPLGPARGEPVWSTPFKR